MRISLLTLTAVLALSLTGCSDKDSSSDSKASVTFPYTINAGTKTASKKPEAQAPSAGSAGFISYEDKQYGINNVEGISPWKSENTDTDSYRSVDAVSRNKYIDVMAGVLPNAKATAVKMAAKKNFRDIKELTAADGKPVTVLKESSDAMDKAGLFYTITMYKQLNSGYTAVIGIEFGGTYLDEHEDEIKSKFGSDAEAWAAAHRSDYSSVSSDPNSYLYLFDAIKDS